MDLPAGDDRAGLAEYADVVIVHRALYHDRRVRGTVRWPRTATSADEVVRLVSGDVPSWGIETVMDAVEEQGLLPAGDVDTLRSSWRLASRVRAANTVWGGRQSDLLPSSRRDLEAVARWCGYGPGQGTELEEDYLRLTRRSRAIFERSFYGYGD